MWTGNALIVAGSLVVALTCASTAVATQDAEPLYVCATPAGTRTLEIGATVCDAASTDALTDRIDVDNLQLRAGALVTEVAADSVLQIAGLQEGDVIYRVGGVDVDDNVTVAARLSLIEEAADTVVNFLRRGRPYRVKIRRP
jgi:C-terminal processing protease CtpA/Prc